MTENNLPAVAPDSGAPADTDAGGDVAPARAPDSRHHHRGYWGEKARRAGPGASSSASDRLAEIKTLMADSRSPYWTGPRDPRTGETLLATEFRDLVEGTLPADDAEPRPAPAAVPPTAEVDDRLVQIDGQYPDLSRIVAISGMDESAAVAAGNSLLVFHAGADPDTRQAMDDFFDALTPSDQGILTRQWLEPRPDGVKHAPQSVLDLLSGYGCADLIRRWGSSASWRIGIAEARADHFVESLTDEGAEQFVHWFNQLRGKTLAHVVERLAR